MYYIHIFCWLNSCKYWKCSPQLLPPPPDWTSVPKANKETASPSGSVWFFFTVCCCSKLGELRQPSISLAPFCGRLLKALTHFQLRLPPHSTPPHPAPDAPKHTAYRSSSAAGCHAAAGLCIQMLEGEGVSCVWKIHGVSAHPPRSCPCAWKCRCTAGGKFSESVLQKCCFFCKYSSL